MTPIGRFVRARLRRRIFLWFGATILLTGLVVAVFVGIAGGWGGTSWHREVARVQTFMAGRFAHVWDDPVEREALARAISQDLAAGVVVHGARGQVLSRFGSCHHLHVLTTKVRRHGRLLGHVQVCPDHRPGGGGWKLFLGLFLAGATLWAASGKIARRLARPLDELVRVAREIGSGNLRARARSGRGMHGETAILATAINDMATRIEKQLSDQRELLAGVSHEIRTPLARIRLLVELAQDKPSARMLEEIDREVVEIDTLVGELLASARLDFAAVEPRPLDAVEVATRALDRAGVSADRLVVEAAGRSVQADPTLLARALANLLENAKKHGGGVSALRIVARADRLSFEVDDQGPGLPEADRERVFQAFYRRATKDDRGVGLGLALTKRIAEAHGGRAYAQNRPEGGARVGIELPGGGSPPK